MHDTATSPVPYASPRGRNAFHTPWHNPPGLNDFHCISTKIGIGAFAKPGSPIHELKRQWACEVDGRELYPGVPKEAAARQNWWTGTNQDPHVHPDPRFLDRRTPPAAALRSGTPPSLPPVWPEEGPLAPIWDLA